VIDGVAGTKHRPPCLGATVSSLSSYCLLQHYSFKRLPCEPLRNRTPGGSPFMNSTPATWKARRSATRVELWVTKIPGLASRRLIVGRETNDAFAALGADVSHGSGLQPRDVRCAGETAQFACNRERFTRAAGCLPHEQYQ
jgi:hypothetical protein